MIENGFYQWILANEQIADLLPSSNNLYMGAVPESAQFPCIMFQKISGLHDTTMDGPSGFTARRYQFNFYGKDTPNTAPGTGYVSCQTLADVFRQQANGLTGTLPDGTKLFNMILDNELDLYDEDDETYKAVRDYMVYFQLDP